MLRVVLDPMRLTSFGLSVADVSDALEDAPFDIPAGSFASIFGVVVAGTVTLAVYTWVDAYTVSRDASSAEVREAWFWLGVGKRGDTKERQIYHSERKYRHDRSLSRFVP